MPVAGNSYRMNPQQAKRADEESHLVGRPGPGSVSPTRQAPAPKRFGGGASRSRPPKQRGERVGDGASRSRPPKQRGERVGDGAPTVLLVRHGQTRLNSEHGERLLVSS